MLPGGKYHMLPTGELLVFSVTSADAHSSYRCRTVHHVTADTVESSSYARLVVTGKFHGIAYSPVVVCIDRNHLRRQFLNSHVRLHRQPLLFRLKGLSRTCIFNALTKCATSAKCRLSLCDKKVPFV